MDSVLSCLAECDCSIASQSRACSALSGGGIEDQCQESYPMKAGDGGGQTLIATAQATEAAGPGKGAFYDPASGQEDETSLGLRKFDDE